jgi:DNA polymerase-1
LLQIPQGGLIRNAFHAEEGRLLSSHDYGAQELRILAHISKDPILLDVYKNGKDVHAMTGVMIYNLSHPDDIVDYDTFQYCREVKDLLCDKEGNPDEGKLSSSNIDHLYSEGKLQTLQSVFLYAHQHHRLVQQ